MARKPGQSNRKLPKARNPVAATLRDPGNGFTQRAIPGKKVSKHDRKRKHKGRPYDEV